MSITAAVLNAVQNLMRRPNIYGGMSAGWKMAVPFSKTITFTKAGYVRIALQSSGGSGACGNSVSGTSSTGGNSGPWGVKVLRVAAGDVMVITLAAGGIAPASSGVNGVQGGTSTVTLNGTTIITAQGGEGGVWSNVLGTVNSPVPSATITGCDFYVPGLRAGSAPVVSGNFYYGGGSASDLLQCGLGRSPSPTAANTPTAGGGVGTDTGATPLPCLVFEDFGLVTGAGSQMPGQGGVGGSRVPGPFGGGASQGSGGQKGYSTAGAGGGGGSGANSALTGDGGPAYAFLQYEPTE